MDDSPVAVTCSFQVNTDVQAHQVMEALSRVMTGLVLSMDDVYVSLTINRVLISEEEEEDAE